MFNNWLKDKSRPTMTEEQLAEYLRYTMARIFEAALPPEGLLSKFITTDHLNEHESERLFLTLLISFEAIALFTLKKRNLPGVTKKFTEMRFKALSELPGGHDEAIKLEARREKIANDLMDSIDKHNSVPIASLNITETATEGIFDTPGLQSLAPSVQVGIAATLLPAIKAFTKALNDFELTK